MRCPDDEKFAQYAEGKLSGDERAEFLQHLGECSECSVLYAMTYKHTNEPAGECPDEENISRLVEGKLSDKAREILLKHISKCKTCSAEFYLLRKSQSAKTSVGRNPVRNRKYQLVALAAMITLIIGIAGIKTFNDYSLTGNSYINAELESNKLHDSVSLSAPVHIEAAQDEAAEPEKQDISAKTEESSRQLMVDAPMPVIPSEIEQIPLPDKLTENKQESARDESYRKESLAGRRAETPLAAQDSAAETKNKDSIAKTEESLRELSMHRPAPGRRSEVEQEISPAAPSEINMSESARDESYKKEPPAMLREAAPRVSQSVVAEIEIPASAEFDMRIRDYRLTGLKPRIYEVIFKGYEGDETEIVRLIQSVASMDEQDAKEILKSNSTVIKSCDSMEEAQKIKDKLELAGASIDIK